MRSCDYSTFNRHEIVNLIVKLKCPHDDFHMLEEDVAASTSFSFWPKLVRNLVVPYDIDELNSKVRILCKDMVIGLKDGDLLKNLKLRLTKKKKKEGYLKARVLIWMKLREFNWAMDCVIDYLDGKVSCSGDVRVLNLKGKFDWNKLYSVNNRECRRLQDGLPIFADRKDILSQVHFQQLPMLMMSSVVFDFKSALQHGSSL
ncbi:hypothetical protein Tco_1082418 [Tanacetum coccineum]|uniref:Uncharacterized protein n=1 Tax=Tanacetum coccineum TaxID=301880 RepID=A0ABQ5I0D8_9ASTR